MRQLTDSFLIEVLKLCFTRKAFLEICREHLKYQFIPIERSDVKIIYKSCLDYFNNTKTLPTIGLISQQHENKPDVQETLSQVGGISIPDNEGILGELENYIKRVRFQLLNEQVVELYNQEKYDDALKLNADESIKISDFSITKGTSYFTRVMKDFPSKMDSIRIQNDEERFKDKVPFNIPPLDALTYGGVEEKETVLIIAPSGIGKSTVVKWIGLAAARLKYKVLHIQLEGSEEECFLKYSQMWTAVNYHSLKNVNVDSKVLEDLYSKAGMFQMKGSDILIHAYEQLEEANVLNIKNTIEQFEKEEGQLPDLLLIDSLDLLHPGDGLKYGYDTQSVKMRLNNTAKRLKNMCMEFGKIRMVTVTQTGDVGPDKLNDPTFVLTRHYTEGDKTLVKSFSYVFTLNQTDEEYKNDIMRIHVDKLRHYKSRQTFKVFTNYSTGRFLDMKRTRKLYEESQQE
jgi:energy-coupling factor transporter ATP-binding protein EcfA2